jgi:malonyl-CoA/methylmalonyl-CoA synthetase
MIELVRRAEGHGDHAAIVTADGVYTYRDLLHASRRAAGALLAGETDLREWRVAYLVSPGFDHVAVQWGIWRAGGVAVPLCPAHPRPELEYVVADSGADTLVADPPYEALLRPVAEERGLRLLTPAALTAGPALELPDVAPDRRALILYTSGTTSKPKGVVTTHANIEAQIRCLVEAWEWTPADSILHFLPLHHIHGVINVLACALWSGARCRMLPRFDAEEVWSRLVADDLTLFMAVPTVYVRLIAAWEAAEPERREAMSAACRRLRLMVSGSAALPVPVLERWRQISGHTLLERYGMTEIGMGLSNPLHGERVPGHVGAPLPGVEVRLVDEEGRDVPTGAPGEISIRGPGVFHEYWGRPEATRGAFRGGWFRTGDVAVLESGGYRILGRSSVDIIKTGGYKVSALEIEEVLLGHPRIAECAVIGIEDPEWGERVAAAVVLRQDAALSLGELRDWARERLAPYKLPTRLLLVEILPRNAMGKVNKPEVRRGFEPQPEA